MLHLLPDRAYTNACLSLTQLWFAYSYGSQKGWIIFLIWIRCTFNNNDNADDSTKPITKAFAAKGRSLKMFVFVLFIIYIYLLLYIYIISILIISECSCISVSVCYTAKGSVCNIFEWFLQEKIPLAKGWVSMKFKLKSENALISFSSN